MHRYYTLVYTVIMKILGTFLRDENDKIPYKHNTLWHDIYFVSNIDVVNFHLIIIIKSYYEQK